MITSTTGTNVRIKSRRMNDSPFILSRLLVVLWNVSAMVMAGVVLLTNCGNVCGNRVFVSAFTARKTPTYQYRNQHRMHPNHCIRVNPAVTTVQHALPQSLSIAAAGSRRSQRSIRSDTTSRQLSRQPPRDTKCVSPTILKNTALPLAASSPTSFVGVALMSAISAGIFSGGLHAIAGTSKIRYVYTSDSLVQCSHYSRIFFFMCVFFECNP